MSCDARELSTSLRWRPCCRASRYLPARWVVAPRRSREFGEGSDSHHNAGDNEHSYVSPSVGRFCGETRMRLHRVEVSAPYWQQPTALTFAADNSLIARSLVTARARFPKDQREPKVLNDAESHFTIKRTEDAGTAQIASPRPHGRTPEFTQRYTRSSDGFHQQLCQLRRLIDHYVVAALDRVRTPARRL